MLITHPFNVGQLWEIPVCCGRSQVGGGRLGQAIASYGFKNSTSRYTPVFLLTESHQTCPECFFGHLLPLENTKNHKKSLKSSKSIENHWYSLILPLQSAVVVRVGRKLIQTTLGVGVGQNVQKTYLRHVFQCSYWQNSTKHSRTHFTDRFLKNDDFHQNYHFFIQRLQCVYSA